MRFRTVFLMLLLAAGGARPAAAQTTVTLTLEDAISRGLVWSDLDGDGRMDLLVTAVAGPARLYRNVAPRHGHWLMVRAIDPALRRDAYGAVVTVRAGTRRWAGLINPGQSYLCSGDPRVHFGLGPVESVDEVRVDWPDGLAEVFPVPGLDR